MPHHTPSPPLQFTISRRRMAVYVLAALGTLVAPLIAQPFLGDFLQTTYGWEMSRFELFAGLAALVLSVAVYCEWRRMQLRPLDRQAPLLLLLFVAFNHLILIQEHTARSFDYNCYEHAAKALQHGGNPYEGTAYLYPPLPAQLMQIAFTVVQKGCLLVYEAGDIAGAGPEDTHAYPDDPVVWEAVFYFFRCMQFVLLCLTYGLLYALGRRLGVREWIAAVLACGMLLVNNPLFRTLHHNQINLWILDLYLTGLLLLPRMPLSAGMLVALAGHLKVYPLAAGCYWLLCKQWRAVAGLVLAFAAILLLQTDWGRDGSVWRQFIDYTKAFRGSTLFRDNSFHSLAQNLAAVLQLHAPGVTVENGVAGTVLQWLMTLAVLIWFGHRFWTRTTLYHAHPDRPAWGDGVSPDSLYLYGQTIDALVLALLVSPLAWEHHYVFVLPLMVWAVALRGEAAGFGVGLAWVLIFGWPTWEVFPVGYHRLAGLLMLVAITSPARIQKRLNENRLPFAPHEK